MTTTHSLLPADMADYHDAVDAKHFGAQAVGSAFDSLEGVAALLAVAEATRGSLDGDDRDQLIAGGADPAAFLPQCRYLRVDGVRGRLGLIAAADLDDAVEVMAVRTKEGAPCSLTVDGGSHPRPAVGWATVIVGPRPDGNGEVLWTAHPGGPVRPAVEDTLDDGATLTVGEVRRQFGDVWLQLR